MRLWISPLGAITDALVHLEKLTLSWRLWIRWLQWLDRFDGSISIEDAKKRKTLVPKVGKLSGRGGRRYHLGDSVSVACFPLHRRLEDKEQAHSLGSPAPSDRPRFVIPYRHT